MSHRGPLTRVWWTHFAFGLFAGLAAGAVSMLWFAAVAAVFEPQDGLGWLPLYAFASGVIGGAIGAAAAMIAGSILWSLNRLGLGPRLYPAVGAVLAAAAMAGWSHELGPIGQLIVGLGAGAVTWRLTRATEGTFSEYRE